MTRLELSTKIVSIEADDSDDDDELDANFRIAQKTHKKDILKDCSVMNELF